MDEAYKSGGFDSTSIGFISGAAVYTIANVFLAKAGAKHRKRSGEQQHSEKQKQGSGMAIAVGSLLDGIPESIVIGVSMIKGGAKYGCCDRNFSFKYSRRIIKRNRHEKSRSF